MPVVPMSSLGFPFETQFARSTGSSPPGSYLIVAQSLIYSDRVVGSGKGASDLSDPSADDSRSEHTQGDTPSSYQRASRTYYERMRKSHTGVYSSAERMLAEQAEKRYQDVHPPQLGQKIQNLGSLITILRGCCGGRRHARGLDFGCGSHWFVDFVRTEYGWDAVGYDHDAYAIRLAQKRFPGNSEYYRCRDPMRAGVPEESSTQDFVFCNAVLQHFDDGEIDSAFSEISRVLRDGGICMLIFKCWTDVLLSEDSRMEKAPRVLNAAAGEVMYFDPTMKAEIDKLDPDQLDGFDELTRDGWRLFHVFRVEQIVEMANRHGMTVASILSADEQGPLPGVIRYRSGKKIPTACVVLRKSEAKVGPLPE